MKKYKVEFEVVCNDKATNRRVKDAVFLDLKPSVECMDGARHIELDLKEGTYKVTEV